MAKLSINVDMAAALRNARRGSAPDPVEIAAELMELGVHGITAHPFLDQRHVTFEDVVRLSGTVKGGLNLEGSPSDLFIRLVRDVRPALVTLVPDSDGGWDTKHNLGFLSEICEIFNTDGTASSVFVAPDIEMIRYAAETGCKAVTLDCAEYASGFNSDREKAVEKYYFAAREAIENGMAVNAGHNLNSSNIHFLLEAVPGIDTVTVGHGFFCDAVRNGMENAALTYLNELKIF